MATHDPHVPAPGYGRRWFLEGLLLLWKAPLFAALLLALVYGAGWAIDTAWTAGMGALVAHHPAFAALAFSASVGLGAAALAPLWAALFFANGHPVPLMGVLRSAAWWGVAAAIPALTVGLLVAFLLVADPQATPDTPLGLLLFSPVSAQGFDPLWAIGAGALLKGLAALALVGPFSLGFGLPRSGDLAFAAFFSRRAKAVAPVPVEVGLSWVGAVFLLGLVVPLVAAPAVALLLAWLHAGAREMDRDAPSAPQRRHAARPVSA